MDALDDPARDIARERWALRTLARNQHTQAQIAAAQRHLDRLAVLARARQQNYKDAKS